MAEGILMAWMKKSGVLGLVMACLGLSSCSDLGTGLSVMWGNYAFQQGDFQKANLEYLKVLESGGRYSDHLKYNLGNVYNALGESNSALAIWGTIPEKTSEDLIFRLSFNKGNLFFQKGLYQEAFNNYKAALLVNPASLEAKRNLELTSAKIQAKGSSEEVQDHRRPGAASSQALQEAKAMLDYIQRFEGDQWKSNRNLHSSPPSSSDW